MATGKRPEWAIPFPYAEAAMADGGPTTLPSTQNETWKFTNLKGLANTAFEGAEPVQLNAADIAALAPFDGDTYRLIIVNGRLVAALGDELSDVPGISISTITAGDGGVTGSDGQLLPLAAMNQALPGDHLKIHLASKVRLERPLRIVFIATPGDAPVAWHPRLTIELDDGAEATVIEQHVATGEGRYWSNLVVSASLQQDAVLRHYRLQTEGAGAWHTASTLAELEERATYDNFVLSTGAALARNEIHMALRGEGAVGHLNGGYLLDGEQHGDTTSIIDHLAPGCASRESYRGVLDGKSRGVFQGKVIVARHAQKSDGEQMSRTLLLSRDAEVNAKPELEIYADDVKCSHGATVGELEDEQLFYLRARGISLDSARNLLIDGFMSEQLELVGDEHVRAAMETTVRRWLAARLEGKGE